MFQEQLNIITQYQHSF